MSVPMATPRPPIASSTSLYSPSQEPMVSTPERVASTRSVSTFQLSGLSKSPFFPFGFVTSAKRRMSSARVPAGRAKVADLVEPFAQLAPLLRSNSRSRVAAPGAPSVTRAFTQLLPPRRSSPPVLIVTVRFETMGFPGSESTDHGRVVNAPVKRTSSVFCGISGWMRMGCCPLVPSVPRPMTPPTCLMVARWRHGSARSFEAVSSCLRMPVCEFITG